MIALSLIVAMWYPIFGYKICRGLAGHYSVLEKMGIAPLSVVVLMLFLMAASLIPLAAVVVYATHQNIGLVAASYLFIIPYIVIVRELKREIDINGKDSCKIIYEIVGYADLLRWLIILFPIAFYGLKWIYSTELV